MYEIDFDLIWFFSQKIITNTY